MTELKDQELSNVTGGLLDDHDDYYSIVINSYTCPKQEVVKVLKEILNIGMKEAQELVDSFPKTILERVTSEEAHKIEDKLTNSGINAEIVVR